MLRRPTRAALCSAVALLFAPSLPALAQGRTDFTNLGTLGGTLSAGHAINASGQVTGGATLAGDTIVHAFRYSGGTMQDLGTLGGTSSDGFSINASGQVAGQSDLS